MFCRGAVRGDWRDAERDPPLPQADFWTGICRHHQPNWTRDQPQPIAFFLIVIISSALDLLAGAVDGCRRPGQPRGVSLGPSFCDTCRDHVFVQLLVV